MAMRFTIVALPISRALKFDLKKDVTYEIYWASIPPNEVAMRYHRKNTSEQSHTILIETSRIIILKQLFQLITRQFY
jgi:hypothetical protein